MKKIIALFYFVSAQMLSYGQCSDVAVQISSSDTLYVQLYQAGFFLIPSGFDNVCEWEVTTFSGDIIHQGITSGDFNSQSFMLFNHSVPISDSMKVTLIITNDTTGINCTINDTLYWQETEVLPGSFIGNWAVLSSNGGVEAEITAAKEAALNAINITLFPSPTSDYFQINSRQDIYSFTIFDLSGQILESYNNVHGSDKVDISNYSPGMYFVQFWDNNKRNLGIQKIIKL